MTEDRTFAVQLEAPVASRAIHIVAAASGRGAPDVGCGLGPEALLRSSFMTRLKQAGLRTRWDATLPPASHAEPLSAVRDVCARLGDRVLGIMRSGARPFVLSGDHSCAIGAWNGVAQAVRSRGSLGLIWIDAHMDAHQPSTSHSGALHGMPLACLLGYGDPNLLALADVPALSPENVCLVGVRSFEPEEQSFLAGLGVRVFYMEEIARRGLADVMAEAHAIASRGSAGFGVTLDVDALDPQDAPGVGSPEPGGLRAVELLGELATIGRDPRLLAVEITEYNPLHDHDGRTAGVVSELAVALLGGERRVTRTRSADQARSNGIAAAA